jgi:hypothetical protein
VHTPNITPSTSQICDCPPCDIPEPTVHPIITRRNMGGYPQGCAKEKDVAFEEETQANGRQGSQGHHEFVQLSSVRRSQEDALPLRELYGQ